MTEEQMHLRAIIFDLDGVLANTTPSHARAFSDLWKEVGVEGPAYDRIAGRSTLDVVNEYCHVSRTDAERLVRFKQERARYYLMTTDISFSDVQNFVRKVSARSIALAVGTGASRATATRTLVSIGLAEVITTVVTADDVHKGKPAPDTFLHALERLGVAAVNALVIEDSSHGLAAGVAAGAWVACVRSGHEIASPRFMGSFPMLQSLESVLCLE